MPSFHPRVLRTVLGASLVLAFMVPAQAGLFDDDEARKAILDLRAKAEEQRLQSAASQKQLSDQVQQLQRSLLDLNNQNEQLRAELARLRGQEEQTQRELADVQRRMKDIGQTVDERMRKFEPQKVSVDGRDFVAEPDEKKAFDDALGVMRNGEFDQAVTAIGAFLKRYPNSGYVDSARYWLGNALYGKRDYRDAVATFRQFATAAPDHLRAPEALLAMANCQSEMKDSKTARKTLEDLVKAYPKSEAAQAARERLTAMK